MARIHSSIVADKDESELTVLINLATWGPFRRVGSDILHSVALKPPFLLPAVLPSPL